MIHIRNVTVIRSGVALLKDFSWHIRENEHWLVTGSNGSGKTTLLNLVAGVNHASHGAVDYNFIKAYSWDDRFAQRKCQIVYITAHALQTLLPGRTDLYYQQRYYSMGGEQIPTVADLFGETLSALATLPLPDTFRIDRLLPLEITRLSNGQLKKVLILKNLARAIPRFLILDYPFEGLDPASREDLVRFLDYLATALSIQLILTDHDHNIPAAINKRLVLDNMTIHDMAEMPKPKEDVMPPKSYQQTQGGEPVVEMRNVTIQYDAYTVLENFNWKITSGQRWALTGKNGSGKTTLFSLIFADHPLVYREQVYLFGKRRGSGESIWEIKKRIAYLGPELIHYFDASTAAQTVESYLASKKTNANQDALEHALLFFDVSLFMDKPVRTLSSGQWQLVLIIALLLSEKELLLLDEPFQFLDPIQKVKVSDYIHQHLHPDTTLILITHDERDLTQWTNLRMHLG